MSLAVRARAAVVGENPFYLPSAVSMLLGCYLMSGAASSSGGGQLAATLARLSWLSLYEVLLIALTAHLTRRGAHRDARTLAVLECAFLVDATHLAGEAIAAAGSVGWWTLALGALSAFKVVALARALGLRPRGADRVFMAAAMGLIHLAPATFAVLRRTGASLDLPLYAAAWLVALMIVAVTRHRGFLQLPQASDAEFDAALVLRSALRIALPVSLGAHVLAVHWMYDAAYPAASVTPLLLALAYCLVGAPDAERAPRLRAAVPLFAVLFSANASRALWIHAGLEVSPLRMAMLAAALLYAFDYARHRQVFAAVLGGMTLATAAGGPTVAASYDAWAALFGSAAHGGGRVVPRTARQWGGLTIVLAYALLAAGAWRSLRGANALKGGDHVAER